LTTSREWTLETARAVIGDVRARTERAFAEVERLGRALAAFETGGAEHAEVGRRIEARLSLWAREMEALGGEVKGPWLVDFDSGAGYFCWRWPEPDLLYYHGYDEGFGGRVPIQ
jgi:hypothetical protein